MTDPTLSTTISMLRAPPGPATARLRVCASCEWIFRTDAPRIEACPKCGFGHYSAHYVYGRSAYRHARTQQPWKDKKLLGFEAKLNTILAKREIGR